MYTQCPDCQTRFRVTADALRAAHGTVRCGRCGSAFDALVRLSDTLPRAVPESAPLPLRFAAEEELAPLDEPFVKRLAGPFDERFEEHFEQPFIEPVEASRVEALTEPGTESTTVLVDEGGVGEDITLEGERVQIEGTGSAGDDLIEQEFDLDATDEFEALKIPASAYPDEREAERELEALILRLQREFGPMPSESEAASDSRDDATAIHRTLSELDAPVPAPDRAEPGAAAALIEEIEPPAGTIVEPVREPPPTAATQASPTAVPVEERPLSSRRWQPEPVEFEQHDVPARSGWRTLAWTVGSLLLVLALAAQLAHQYRRELARDARLGPPLRAAYERLGLAVPPSADLAALELRQSGEESRANGRLEVRARLTNRAGFEQPYPILRLQFEDRFGTVVAKRDFEPAEYLRDPALAAGTLAPGASGDAELLLVDPGVEAVGFRLDVCLRESPGLLQCAQEPGER
jgi:predicted Zn finger-like uncharacterized protein